MRVIVGAQAGRAVVHAARGQGGGVEGVNLGARGGQGDVAGVDGLFGLHDPEVRLSPLAQADGVGELHDDLVTDGGQRRLVEAQRPTDVLNAYADVIEHGPERITVPARRCATEKRSEMNGAQQGVRAGGDDGRRLDGQDPGPDDA